MREIAEGTGIPLKLTRDQLVRLREYLVLNHKRAEDAYYGVYNKWKAALQLYQGEPPEKLNWVPFENAPTIEVTIGASACDSVLAQAEDLIFQVKPPLTLRSRKEEFDDTADAFQELVNHGVESGFWNFEAALKESLLSCVQLGPMIGYVPFVKTIRKTDIRKVTTVGPKCYAVSPENFIIPPNATKDMQNVKWCTMRTYMDRKDVRFRSRLSGWSLDETAAADSESVVRKNRMWAGGLTDTGEQPRIPIGNTFIYWDLDDDGEDSDLQVIWNMASGNILKCTYNKFDSRPFVFENYQDRAFLAYGIGVMEMMIPYERELTEIHNNHIWNMMISNTKMYSMPQTMMNESEEIYPGKRWASDDGEVKAIDMGEANPTALQAEAVVSGMARERVGVQNLTAPIRSSSRTPGISMLSMMQQANRRFTHPFNNMRNFGAKLCMQALYRLQEQVRGGSEKSRCIAKIKQIMGDEKADLIIKLFRRNDVELSDALDIQLTASSVSVNRESDRQNMVMLATQVLPLYWNAKKELAQFIATPPFAGADRVAKEADKALDKIFSKIIKTFDQIADVRSLQIDLGPIDEAMQQLGGQGITPQIQQMMNGGNPQNNPAGPPLAPQGPIQ